ncbi:MAG: SMC-Scp complex subunit ScpB [Alphaproteobacteria bacterium]|nr:MAG: SMC-Scp complex subunit ScpB [Alphaproteobacteria bacterium]
MDRNGDEQSMPSSPAPLPEEDLWAAERMVEALIFAAEQPLSIAEIRERLPRPVDVEAILERLTAAYEGRGIALVQVAGGWQFRTAPDLAFLLRREDHERRRLSRAALETLAIIAYHQPVTRAEIEEIRGVSLSKGTLDLLLEAGWVKPAGRRKSPGLPLEFRTTDEFLSHFGLNSLEDLPGLAELKAAGLLDSLDEALARMEEEAAAEANRTPAEDDPPPSAEEGGT